MLSSAVENVTAIINTAFLGHLSSVALGASALGGIFYLALIMLGFGFGIGVQILIARRYGEKKLYDIGNVLHQALLFLLSFGIIFVILFYFKGIYLFGRFIHSAEIFKQVDLYLSYRIWGLLFAYINILFRAFYTGIMRTRVVGYYSFILAAINIFFDYALIFGHFGFPRMEIAGAGFSSVIAEVVALIFFIIYTYQQKNISDFRLLQFNGIDFQVFKRVLKIASPIMLQFSFSFGGWFLFFMFVEKMGEIPLAVSNLIRTFYLVALLPLWGYASVTNTLVSYQIGSGKLDELKLLVCKILRLSFSTITLFVIILNIFSTSYLNLFTDNKLLIDMSKPIVYIVSATSILVSISIILYNIISGIGKTQITLLIEAMVMFYYVLWAYLVAYVWNGTVEMIWMSEIWYGILMGLLASLYLKYGKWKKTNI